MNQNKDWSIKGTKNGSSSVFHQKIWSRKPLTEREAKRANKRLIANHNRHGRNHRQTQRSYGSQLEPLALTHLHRITLSSIWICQFNHHNPQLNTLPNKKRQPNTKSRTSFQRKLRRKWANPRTREAAQLHANIEIQNRINEKRREQIKIHRNSALPNPRSATHLEREREREGKRERETETEVVWKEWGENVRNECMKFGSVLMTWFKYLYESRAILVNKKIPKIRSTSKGIIM